MRDRKSTFKRREAWPLAMKGRSWLARWRKPRNATEDALWPRALAAGRAAATALTLVVFVASLTLDDLRLFRFSSAFVGGGLAVALFAFTPPFFAGRLVSRALVDAPGTEAGWMEGALMRRRAFLGLAIALVVLWLVFFSSGRTPRW